MEWKYWGEPFAKTYMKLEGHHQALRIAEGIKKVVEVMPLQLNTDNLIIGSTIPRSIISYNFGSGVTVDYGLGNEFIKNCEDTFLREEIQGILNYFSNEDTLKKISESVTEEEKKSSSMRVFWAGGWGGHTLLDYSLILNNGTSGLKEQIKIRIEEEKNKTTIHGEESSDIKSNVNYQDKALNDTKTLEWLQALYVICEALELFAERYAEKAHSLLAIEKETSRLNELIEIERICRKVPKEPSKTWREALQCFWFTFVFDGVDSPGRFDQYMYPYLKHSLDCNEINMEKAQNLLEKLWLRFEEVRAWNLCVGGQTTQGKDATNELSYMILDAAKQYGFQAPNLTMRCHNGTPESLWNKAFEVIETGIGMPALYNDEVVIPAMLRFGIPLEDARDYGMNGCNQIDIQGKSYMGLEDGELNLLKCLELALNRGCCLLTGEKLGIDTGDPLEFISFDDIMNAYKSQVNHFIKMLTNVANKSQKVYAEHGPNPFRSLLISDCLKKARDFRAGGPRYNNGQILAEGIANTADSLAAIKKFIFETKRVSFKELLEALNTNFKSAPKLQSLLLNKGNHYGNDDDYVDSIAWEIVEHFFTELMKYKTFRGGIYGGGCSTFTRAPEYGKQVAATADGRSAYLPVADSSGAVQGRDVKGPTALLNSSSKIDHSLAQSGYVLNLKFDKSSFIGEEAKFKFTSLIKTFFENGGQQVQVNVTSAESLKSAQEHPEDFKNLVVRVGGFSAYFVDLDKDLQDDIISRTSHRI